MIAERLGALSGRQRSTPERAQGLNTKDKIMDKQHIARGGVKVTPQVPSTSAHYPRWTQRHANEDFDRAQSLASKLTEEDRAAGRPAPFGGHSGANFAKAKAIVKAAQT